MAYSARFTLGLVIGAVMVGLGIFVIVRLLAMDLRPLTGRIWLDFAFAALFLLQGALFFWRGVVQGHLSFAPWRNAWAPVGWVLIAYSLLYPGINAVLHFSVSRIQRSASHARPA